MRGAGSTYSRHSNQLHRLTFVKCPVTLRNGWLQSEGSSSVTAHASCMQMRCILCGRFGNSRIIMSYPYKNRTSYQLSALQNLSIYLPPDIHMTAPCWTAHNSVKAHQFSVELFGADAVSVGY